MNIILHYNQQTYQLDAPTTVPLYQLTPALAQKLDLPQQSEDGTVYLYYLLHGEEPVDPTQTLQQLPYTNHDYTLAYREMARPEVQTMQPSRQANAENHLRITSQDINDPILIRRRPQDIPNPNRLRLEYLPLLVIILLVCGASFMVAVIDIGKTTETVTAVPPTNTPNNTSAQTTLSAPTGITSTQQGNYELEGRYEKIIYSHTTNELLAYSTNGTILSIYDLDWTKYRALDSFPRTFNGKQYISYIAFDENNPIQDITLSHENRLKALITQANGYRLFTIASNTHFPVADEADACKYFATVDRCFTPPIQTFSAQPSDPACPVIWENSAQYLDSCAQVFSKEENRPLFTFSLAENEIVDLFEARNGTLFILGNSQLAIYNPETMARRVLGINNVGRWSSIQAKNVFVSNDGNSYYVVYQPEEAVTNWLWVGEVE